MNFRLFIAYPLTSGIISKIGFLEKEIEENFKLKIPWIPLKNLHLTVIFLGNIKQEDYFEIEEIFEEKLPFKIFDIKVKKLDYGPPNKKRMIWLYVEKNKNLEIIKKFFEDKLNERKINYKREEREYLPHINLARLKREKDLPEIKKDLNWSFRISEVSLFQSFLKKEGAEYKILKSLYLIQS